MPTKMSTNNNTAVADEDPEEVMDHLPKGYLRIPSSTKSGGEGRQMRVVEVLENDPMRQSFLRRLTTDGVAMLKPFGHTFQKNGKFLDPQQAVKQYRSRVQVGPKCRIPSSDALMCTDLFDKVTVLKRDEAKGTGNLELLLQLPSKKEVTVSVPKKTSRKEHRSKWFTWDETHDDDSIDDLTELNAFSEAPLLRTLKRRFLDLNNIRIYAYVSDILIALNPYMELPALINIPPKDQVPYQAKKNPHTYVLRFANARASCHCSCENYITHTHAVCCSALC